MLPQNTRLHLFALLLLGAPVVSGCGSGEVLGKVSGSVSYQGQRLDQGLVLFRNRAQGVHMTAEIRPDGTYEVLMAKGYGLPLGDYEVCLSPPIADLPLGPALAPPPEADVSRMPERYRDFSRSGLTLRVERGRNRYEIDMQP